MTGPVVESVRLHICICTNAEVKAGKPFSACIARQHTGVQRPERAL